jgi:hypothetical protein
MSDWDGAVDVYLEKDGLKACVMQEYCMWAPISFSTKHKLYMTVATRPAKEHQKSSLSLKRITARWMLPEMPDDARKWFYISTEDFDPEEFLEDIGR